MTSTEPLPGEFESRNRRIAIVAVLLLVGLALRVAGINKEALWYDELYSATQASVSLSDVPASVRAFDLHPPVYYLQLSLWEKFDSSDAWLRLNSSLWWLLGGVSLYYALSRVATAQVAVLAIVFYVVNPTGIHFARELRMYSLLTFLAIWSFYFSERFLQGGSKADMTRSGALLLLTTITVIYSHGAGFLILLCMWTQALLMTVSRQTSFQTGFRFMLVQAFALLSGIPEHMRAASMQSNYGGLSYAIAPSASELLRQSSWLFVGFGEAFGRWTTVVTVSITLIPLLAACWTKGPARRAVLCYVLVPIAACCAISHLSGPIWVFRAISFSVPFCCFGLAYGLLSVSAMVGDRCSRTGRTSKSFHVRLGYACVLLCFFAYAIDCQSAVRPRISHFKRAVEYVQANSSANDVVFVPQEFSYWSFCWYFVSPGSVDPLSDAGIQRSVGGQIIAKMKPIDEAAAELLAGSDSRKIWMLVRGQPQAEKILEEIESRQGIKPRLIAELGKIGLWQLQLPSSNRLLANQP